MYFFYAADSTIKCNKIINTLKELYSPFPAQEYANIRQRRRLLQTSTDCQNVTYSLWHLF
jgi:hypothetical protein